MLQTQRQHRTSKRSFKQNTETPEGYIDLRGFCKWRSRSGGALANGEKGDGDRHNSDVIRRVVAMTTNRKTAMGVEFADDVRVPASLV